MSSEETSNPLVHTRLLQFQEITTPDPKPPPIWFSRRFFVSILLFFGYVSYSMGGQVISIAIVEMISRSSGSGSLKNHITSEDPKYHWDSVTVGLILNMFWYGHIFIPLGGSLSHRFRGATTLGVSLMLSGLVVFLTPFALKVHFYLFLLCRGLVGLLEGFSSASNAEIFARWVPKQERAIFLSSVINGLYFGTAATSPLCGFLIYYWGWPMSFYGAGTFCIVWSLLWITIVRNDPTDDKWISEKELSYIKKGTGNNQKNETHPYKDMLLSPPFWALSLCKFTFGGVVSFIVGYFPSYVKDATEVSIDKVGLLSSIPNSVNMLIIPVAGILTNYWQQHSKLEDTRVPIPNMPQNLDIFMIICLLQIHKLILSSGFIFSSCLFVIITCANNFTISMTCFVLIKIVLSYNKILLELITVGMAPNHSSLCSGLSLFWQTTGTIAMQNFIGYVVRNHRLEEWNFCFFCSTGFLLFTTLTFEIYGSSDPQLWSISQNIDTRIEQPLK